MENIAVRSNGQILASVLTAPELYQVDPSKKRAPVLVHSFPSTGVTGNAELSPDVFYVATGNITSDVLSTVPGSFAIWEVDLRKFSINPPKPARVSKIADFPDARLLNGVAVLDHRKGLLLVADSFRGLIWQLNVHTAEIKVFTDDILATPAPNAPLPIGVNGIKVRNGNVYFSNTSRGLIARLAISRDGVPKGPAVVVVKVDSVDDFALGPNGAFFPAENLGNVLAYAPAVGGDARAIANITNPTAAAFGRRPDAKSLYVSSFGGSIGTNPPPRGKISKVNVEAFVHRYS